MRGPVSEIDQYVHEYFSVAKFKATYADNLPLLEGKQQWDVVDPGFKLSAPLQNRPPGRPRKTRIRAKSEGKGLGGRKNKCSRCGKLGHKGSHCKESIDPAFGEEEHWGANNANDEPLATMVDAATDDVNADAATYDDTNETMADAATDDANADASDEDAANANATAGDDVSEKMAGDGDAANANATSTDATTASSAVRYFFGLFLKLFPKFFNVC